MHTKAETSAYRRGSRDPDWIQVLARERKADAHSMYLSDPDGRRVELTTYEELS